MATWPRTIAGVYGRSHEKFAERSAIRDARRQLTYAELGRDARKFANALRAAGFEPGSRVIVIGANSCDWVVVDQALALGDYSRVGLLPRLHPAELGKIAADIEPVAVVAEADWLAGNGSAWVPDGVDTIITIGGPAEEGHVSLDRFIATATDEALPEPASESIVWVQYTSGSTGQPKGVLTSQGAVAAMVRNALREVEFRQDDVSLHTAPISHFGGTVLMDTNAVGGLNILQPSFEVEEVVSRAKAGEVTVLPLVPTMITMTLEELVRQGRPDGAVGAIRMIPYGGSAIGPDRAARALEFFGPVLTQFYGSSEAMLPISILHPAEHVDEEHLVGVSRLASAGRPIESAEVRIAGEDGALLPRGGQGEIEVRSETLSGGYWRRPEETARVFADGWVRTGDVGCFDDDGFLYILDRRKDMIITGGFNVYPREVENVISTLTGVREVAVIGAPDPRWGELITAVVAVESDSEISADDVISFCRSKVGGYKVPKRIEFVAELPKGGTGKVLKTQLRDELWADRVRKV